MVRESDLRTDRGFVVINDMEEGRKHVEICMSVRPNGTAQNVFAEHVGVPQVVLDSPSSFRRQGPALVSTVQMEVYISADDGLLHVTPVTDWDRVGA